MSSPQQFKTIAHEARREADKCDADSQDQGSRSLLGFTGLLIGSIAGMIKKLAFNEPNHAASNAENIESDGETDAGPGKLTTHTDSQRHGKPSDRAGGDSASELPGASFGEAGRFHHAIFRGEDPAPLRDSQMAAPPVPALPLLPANDNTGLRLPLSAQEHSSPRPRGASAANLAPTDSEDAPVQAGDAPDSETAAERPAADTEEPKQSNERNRGPVITGPVNLGQLYVNTALVIGLTDLLPHATDPDGDTLAITDLVAARGNLVEGDDNSWNFTPALDDVGQVTFSYAVTDGEFSVTQTATLDLFEHALVRHFATDGDDVLIGTRVRDDIVAHGGSDIVDGLAGDDLIDGGDGDDVIFGGSGHDLIFAGNGDDFIDAGDGDDIVFAGSGNDVVIGGDGDDVIHGEAGNDSLNAGSGDDVADAGDGDDVFVVTHVPGSGAALPNQVQADTGSASIATVIPLGNTAAGVIAATAITSGEAGATSTAAAPSEDATATPATVTVSGDGNDFYDGGAGIDTLDLGATSAAAVVDLACGTASSDDIGTDILKNIENVVTGSGDDTIIANTAQNVLTGGAGEDTFVFATACDSGTTPEAIDSITDFEVGDKIDVSQIDGDEKADGKQSFEFKGKADHFEKAAEIIYKYEKHEDGEHTIVSGNDDDDLDADFSIDLFGHLELTHEDFHGLS